MVQMPSFMGLRPFSTHFRRREATRNCKSGCSDSSPNKKSKMWGGCTRVRASMDGEDFDEEMGRRQWLVATIGASFIAVNLN